MMKYRLARLAAPAALVLTGLVLAASAAHAQGELFDESSIRGYDEYTGAYGQFGVAIGRVDYDDIGRTNVDSEAFGGFTMTVGYRVNGWVSAEGNFTYLGGDDNVEIGRFDGDGEAWAFTFGPKIYPLGLVEVDAVPHYIQPYGLIGIGGGKGEVDFGRGADFDEGSFVARFIIGFDVWATDNIGLFVEGGGAVAEEDEIDGLGIFTFGGQYRF